jgi:hypothetical protein
LTPSRGARTVGPVYRDTNADTTRRRRVDKLRLGVIGAGSGARPPHLANFGRRRDEADFT